MGITTKTKPTATTSATTSTVGTNVSNNTNFNLKVNEIKHGDVFSETSHYTFLRKDAAGFLIFKNLTTGVEVTLSSNYVEKFLIGADQYHSVVKVTREDKRDGTLGIRSIFQNIYNSDVFIAGYYKQAEKLKVSEYQALLQQQKEQLLASVEKAVKSKKSSKEAVRQAIEEAQNNPILKVKEPELRVLRGYKIQFESRDGKYNCIDMTISQNVPEIRPVNINTLEFLIYKGVRYEVVG